MAAQKLPLLRCRPFARTTAGGRQPGSTALRYGQKRSTSGSDATLQSSSGLWNPVCYRVGVRARGMGREREAQATGDEFSR